MASRNFFATLKTLFRTRGQAPYAIGETLSIEQHSLQSWHFIIGMVEYLSKQPSYYQPSPRPNVWLAALTHDVGHMLVPKDINPLEPGAVDDHHEKLGAAWLHQQGLPPSVCQPVALHVDAKRYLVTENPHYYQKLSAASRASLKLQGGPMTAAEVNVFKAHPWFKDALWVRMADDMAKNADRPRFEFEGMVGGEAKFTHFVDLVRRM